MTSDLPINRLETALEARAALFDEPHEAAFRLFNGFLEGFPDLAVDLYGRTLLLHSYHKDVAAGLAAAGDARDFYLAHLPWLEAVVLKSRHGAGDADRRGRIIYGAAPTTKIREHGIRYAVDLLMNRDASFYLDTRLLRQWLYENMTGLTVLNTFAYTGSLGVAAAAGGAARVVHVDRNRRFLNLAKDSYTLNGLPIDRQDFQTADFWPYMNRLKRTKDRFDCVLIDPPFFSTTRGGTVDLASNAARLINKVRPLVKHGGRIVAINNALFLSGRAYLDELEALGAGGYVELETIIPVPADFTGTPATRAGEPITDPTPFNHSTKIAVLRIHHKG